MPGGIIVFNAEGSKKTALGKELPRQLNFHHFDLDDYYWRWDTEVVPFTIFRPSEEIIEHLMRNISKHPYFVMSGSMGAFAGCSIHRSI